MLDALPKFLIYTGLSMHPTLKVGDLLRVVAYSDGRLPRWGDVVVFSFLGKDNKVVHRVVSRRGKRVFTKGDNNKTVDAWIVSPSDILGRVVYAVRGKRKIVIYGGIRGKLVAGLLRIKYFVRFFFYSLFKSPYYWLSQKGYLRKTWPAIKKSQLFMFNKTNGVELQLFIGKKLVGWLSPNYKKWFIKAPFRLFIDERSLSKVAQDVNKKE